MLNPYTYIAFDFETTGLDTQKDEPIQIGLVRFWADGQIIDTFQSLIKPKKPLKELKDIVRFLTGFSLDDLKDAPTMEELLPQLKEFFSGECIAVWHNIGFDIAMLQKYMNFDPIWQVDTYPLSKQLMHYIPSYALDVLHQSLVYKELIEPTTSDGSAHDALHDSLMSYDLFLYLADRFDQLRRKYLIIDSLLQKSEGFFTTIIKRSQKQFSYDEKKLFLPSLKRTVKWTKKVTVPTPIQFPEEWWPHHTVSAKNWSIHRLLSNIDWSSRKWVITTTHKSKQNRIQSILDSLFVSWTTLHDQLVFDEEMINLFLHKETFTDEEIWFIAKYFSQYEQEHSQIDTNTPHEYRILKALSTYQPRNSPHVALCTHQQLRKFKEKITDEHTILFLDNDRRYQSFASVQKQSFDPYYLLHCLEDIEYSSQLRDAPYTHEVQAAIQAYTIFLWVQSAEINQYFKGHANTKVDIDFLIDDPRAPKTRGLITDLSEQLTSLSQKLEQKEQDELLWLFTQLTEHLTGLTTVQKRMYQGDKRYFQFNHREQFVDYSDFIESLPPATYYFVTSQHKNQALPLSIPEAIIPPKRAAIHTTPKPRAVISHLLNKSWKGNKYIISASKHQSQLLFKELVASNLQKDYTIVAENITGWVGKNVFHALQSKKPVIALWGYAFYLELVAKKFAFSDLYCYHIFGPMKAQIITDMVRYAS